MTKENNFKEKEVKKMSEFNLSDKMIDVNAKSQQYYKKLYPQNFYWEGDIKTFIKKLREETDKIILKCPDFKMNVAFSHQQEQILNKLLGENLNRK